MTTKVLAAHVPLPLAELKWTSKALSGLARLYEFLALVNKLAAAHTVQLLTAAPAKLLEHPRIGEQFGGQRAVTFRTTWRWRRWAATMSEASQEMLQS